ncbi:tetratricopeptide repeat protein [Dongia sp.]|uniref:tetratricopeptide repeat protein n=1 Tax=Dongia sp. TaxID=1977262 RepID=UPI0035AECB73
MNRKSRRTAAKQLRSSDFKGTDKNSVALLLDQAVAAAQAANWAEAERILQHLLTVDPNHAEALHMMGLALSSTGRVNEGIDFLKRATQQQPGEALYWNNLATGYSAAHLFVEATAAARKAVTLEPGYAAAWCRFGDTLNDIKDYANACDAYQRYRTLAGTDHSVEKRIANCLMNLGRLEEAEACLKTLRDQAPDDVEALGNLGAVLVARRKYSEAIPCLEAATAADRKKYSTAFHYARALEGTDQTALAIQWLRRATSIEHRSGEAWLLLGELLLKTGEIGEALTSAKRASTFLPASAEAADLLRRVQFGGRSVAGAAAARPGPAMWDFHLGDGTPEMTVPNDKLQVTFDKPAAGGHNGRATPASEKAAIAKPETPKQDSSTGILDLTVLKIG